MNLEIFNSKFYIFDVKTFSLNLKRKKLHVIFCKNLFINVISNGITLTENLDR